MRYYILEKKGKHQHTTSQTVVKKYRKEGYELIGTIEGIDLKFRWIV